jgi:hypothetical protein
MKKRGTRHGKGRGKWRKEYRKYKKKDGTISHYWNWRERNVRVSGAKNSSRGRKIRYRPGGKTRGRPKRTTN